TTLVPARSRTPVTGGHYVARTNRRPARPPAPAPATLPAVPAGPARSGPAGGGAPVTDARRGGLRGRRPHRRSPGRCGAGRGAGELRTHRFGARDFRAGEFRAGYRLPRGVRAARQRSTG